MYTKMRRTNAKSTWTALAVCLLFVLLMAALFLYLGDREEPQTPLPADDGITVHFIDVGQGDCAIVQTPDGNLLIDAGTPDSAQTIRRYADALGITEFAYAIFTHPHADHIGSAAALVEAYQFDSVILPNAVSTSSTFEHLLDALEKENCEMIEGKSGVGLTLGKLKIDLLAPVGAYDDLNDMSVVALLTYDGGKFLFTGDAEAVSEADILKTASPDCDVLKVGHHGSSTSSSEAFLTAASPEIAVISVGEGNSYGHPHASIVKRLETCGAEIYRTDLCGSVVVSFDGENYTVTTEK